MASKTSSSFVAVLLVFNVLLALAGHAVARRNTPKSSKNLDKKQPQFLIDSDGSFLIPGIGRVVLPPKYTHLPFGPFTGHTGAGGTGSGSGGIGSGSGSGSGSGLGHNYIPGGDDTFVPNPGYEIPNPSRGVSIPPPTHP